MTNNKIFAAIINCLIEFTILKCVRLDQMLRDQTYDFMSLHQISILIFQDWIKDDLIEKQFNLLTIF